MSLSLSGLGTFFSQMSVMFNFFFRSHTASVFLDNPFPNQGTVNWNLGRNQLRLESRFAAFAAFALAATQMAWLLWLQAFLEFRLPLCAVGLTKADAGFLCFTVKAFDALTPSSKKPSAE